MTFLAILNTIMTAGILAGVWLSYLKPNAGLKEVLGDIRAIIAKIIDKVDG